MSVVLSPVSLLRLLLQAGQQRVQAVVVAVQQPRRQLAEVGVVLLIEQREGQVAPRPDVVQDEVQHVSFHHPVELCHKPGEELHPDLSDIFQTRSYHCFVFVVCFLVIIRLAGVTHMRHSTLSNRLLRMQDALHRLRGQVLDLAVR